MKKNPITLGGGDFFKLTLYMPWAHSSVLNCIMCALVVISNSRSFTVYKYNFSSGFFQLKFQY